MTVRLGSLIVVVLAGFGLAGCSDDSDDSSSTTQAAAPVNADDDAGADNADGDSGGGEGTLTLGDEEIALGAGLCFLQEQDAAAGGGTIELTGQASGTNAAGDEVLVDFSRFSTESQFTGDDISVTIGDPFAGNATSLSGVDEIGAVSLDGSVLNVSGFEVSGDDGSVVVLSFDIAC